MSRNGRFRRSSVDIVTQTTARRQLVASYVVGIVVLLIGAFIVLGGPHEISSGMGAKPKTVGGKAAPLEIAAPSLGVLTPDYSQDTREVGKQLRRMKDATPSHHEDVRCLNTQYNSAHA